MMRSLNILTVDLEDWFHVLDNQATRTETEWAAFESRIPGQIEQLLAQFAHHNVYATFFVLGWVAERFPELVAKVHEAGHEIACHSNMHQLVYEQSPDAFRTDLETAVKNIEKATGQRPRAFRAPGFSITRATPWAFEILAEQGFDTDCSIFPAPRAHGGFEGYGDGVPAIIRTSSGSEIREFPMNYATVLGRPLVYGGGGYFRLIPGVLGRQLFRQSNYNMTYFHLRDFDAGQPMIPGLSPARRFKSYVGISGATAKLDRLLAAFDFVTLRKAAGLIAWKDARVFDLEKEVEI
ncbi:polysaccharide deacetylase family protein [Rhodobacter sp. NSM]|uniref:polysaccharide deacetylase family protein n=1 Tax=Rhodobacter sp. NSM TaxID=3457501 RepID=UPI003FD3B76B